MRLSSPLGGQVARRTANRLKFVGIRCNGSLYTITVTGPNARNFAGETRQIGFSEWHCGPLAPTKELRRTAARLLSLCGANPQEAVELSGVFARRTIKGLQGDCWRMKGEDVTSFIHVWRSKMQRWPDLRTMTTAGV